MKYDFKCDKCGVFEVNQKITETTKTVECPTCGAEARKQITASYQISCERADGQRFKSISRIGG